MYQALKLRLWVKFKNWHSKIIHSPKSQTKSAYREIVVCARLISFNQYSLRPSPTKLRCFTPSVINNYFYHTVVYAVASVLCTQARLVRSQQRFLATMPAWWVLIRTKLVVGCLGSCCWWSCGKFIFLLLKLLLKQL